MRPFSASALLVLWLAGPVAAAPQAETPAAQEASPAQKQLDELVKSYKKQQSEASEKRKKATTDAERQEALKLLDGPGFIAKFRALAQECPGTDTAARAMLWTLRVGLEREPAREVVADLLEEHMDSEVLVELVQELSGSAAVIGADQVEKTLGELIEFSSNRSVKGNALFALGSKQIGSKDATVKSVGRKALERVVAEFADLSTRRGTIGAQASGILFRLDKLQLGMVAPEMEAVDENGVAWKLSDYRGKVVLVDFWGYW